MLKIKQNFRSFFLFLIMFLSMSFIITGCVKFQFNININENGSGNFKATVGMTKQLLAIVGSDALDKIMLQQGVNSSVNPNVKISKHTDETYEWVDIERLFNNIDEIQSTMKDLPLFTSFTIKREPSLFTTKFVLDAEMDSKKNFFANAQKKTGYTSQTMDSNALDLIATGITISLPGKIIESDGLSVEGTQNIKWSALNDKPVKIHAVSEVTDITKIVTASVLTLFGVLLVIILIGLTVFSTVFNKNKQPRSSVLVPSSSIDILGTKHELPKIRISDIPQEDQKDNTVDIQEDVHESYSVDFNHNDPGKTDVQRPDNRSNPELRRNADINYLGVIAIVGSLMIFLAFGIVFVTLLLGGFILFGPELMNKGIVENSLNKPAVNYVNAAQLPTYTPYPTYTPQEFSDIKATAIQVPNLVMKEDVITPYFLPTIAPVATDTPLPQVKSFVQKYHFQGVNKSSTDIFSLDKGIVRIKWNYVGESNFYAGLKQLDKKYQDERIDNAIGNSSGQVILNVDSSDQYIIDVEMAMGRWDFTVDWMP